MSGIAVNLIIAAIIIGIVTLVDFSVFFISKDTENLLYYDENSVDEDSFETDDECENEDDTDSDYLFIAIQPMSNELHKLCENWDSTGMPLKIMTRP